MATTPVERRAKGIGRLHDIITEHLRSVGPEDDEDSIADALIDDLLHDKDWSFANEGEPHADADAGYWSEA